MDGFEPLARRDRGYSATMAPAILTCITRRSVPAAHRDLLGRVRGGKEKARRWEPAGLRNLVLWRSRGLAARTSVAHARTARPVKPDDANVLHVLAIGQHGIVSTRPLSVCQHSWRKKFRGAGGGTRTLASGLTTRRSIPSAEGSWGDRPISPCPRASPDHEDAPGLPARVQTEGARQVSSAGPCGSRERLPFVDDAPGGGGGAGRDDSVHRGCSAGSGVST